MVTIRIPSAMRSELIPDVINSSGTTVSSVLQDLPDYLRKKLLKEDGTINRFINIFVGSDDIRDGLNSILKDGDEVSLVPAIAGGIE